MIDSSSFFFFFLICFGKISVRIKYEWNFVFSQISHKALYFDCVIEFFIFNIKYLWQMYNNPQSRSADLKLKNCDQISKRWFDRCLKNSQVSKSSCQYVSERSLLKDLLGGCSLFYHKRHVSLSVSQLLYRIFNVKIFWIRCTHLEYARQDYERNPFHYIRDKGLEEYVLIRLLIKLDETMDR